MTAGPVAGADRSVPTRRFSVCGRCVEVVSDDDGLLPLLQQRLPALVPGRPGARVDTRYLVSRSGEGLRLAVNGRRRGSPRDRLGTVNRIVSHLQLDLARHARGFVFVHAGVVRIGGVAVVVPGRSFSGKSTLVEAFCAAGATYASDEFAVLDARGRVHPFARPLALRRAGGGVERIDPGRLAGGVVRRPCRVGLVLLPRYRPGAHWSPRQLSRARALLELLRHAVAGRERPEATMAALRRVVESATVLAGERGDAREVVESVRALLRRRE